MTSERPDLAHWYEGQVRRLEELERASRPMEYVDLDGVVEVWVGPDETHDGMVRLARRVRRVCQSVTTHISVGGNAEHAQQSADFLRRGVQCLHVVPPTAITTSIVRGLKRQGIAHEYTVTRGAYSQLIIVDRELVLLLAPPDPTGEIRSVLVDKPDVVDAACRTWDLLVARGRPLVRTTLPRHSLTPRQERVLDLLADGAKDEQMARELGVSVRTVRQDVRAVLSRAGVSSRFTAGSLIDSFDRGVGALSGPDLQEPAGPSGVSGTEGAGD